PFHPHTSTSIHTLSLHDALPILPARSCPHPCRPLSSHRRRSAAGSASNPSLRFDSHAADRQIPRAVRQVRRCETVEPAAQPAGLDRKSTRLNSSHLGISYAVFCL